MFSDAISGCSSCGMCTSPPVRIDADNACSDTFGRSSVKKLIFKIEAAGSKELKFASYIASYIANGLRQFSDGAKNGHSKSNLSCAFYRSLTFMPSHNLSPRLIGYTLLQTANPSQGPGTCACDELTR